MRKALMGVAAFAALTLGLTACGADPTAQEDTAVAENGGNESEILIGGSLNLDGEQSAYDALILEGIEVAFAEANENGGVLGKQIVWENLNGASDTTTIANNAEVLIERGAEALIAPADFDYGSPAARAAQDAGIVGISPGATSPSYGSDMLGDKQFTIGYWNTAMGAAAAEWAYNEQDFRDAYVVTYDGLDYTESLSRYFIESWENAGGNIVAEDIYSGGGDFSAQLQRLRGVIDDVDVIYISVYNPDLAQFIREIRASGIETMILGGDGYDGPELSDSLGEEFGNNIYYVTHAFLSEDASPNIPTFIDTFTEQTGAEPLSILEALGYDTATTLIQAIEAAGTTDGEAVAQQMTEMEFDLLSGKLTWASAEDGHEPQKETAIVYLDEGQPVFDKWFKPEWTPEP
ncbi:ABC transporter substrate-binding protein [Enteractinococcus helveticum]|nr:ABC transporter substrate-binding protein [Enteractinococcus helveticum]